MSIIETTPAPAQTPTESTKLQLDLAQRLALGTRLTELREEKGLTQLEVARQALGFEVSHAAVSRLERGILDKVEEDRLHKLAAFYGETVESLLEEMRGRDEDIEPEEYRSCDALVVQPGFGRRLYNMRQAAGLTKVQMAEKLGFAPTARYLIKQWETEEVKPRPDTLMDIAVKFEVSATWLITGKRAKPAEPTFAMRMRAMQKLYDLSNRELGVLAGFDIEHGRADINRYARSRCLPSEPRLNAVAKALDVPVEWISPPTAGYQEPTPPQTPIPTFNNLTPRTQAFIRELAELFAMGVLTDDSIGELRKSFMKDLMRNMRRPATVIA